MGKTYINVDKKYEITSKNLIYDREKNIILSNNETTIRDNKGNVLNLEERFKLNLNNEIISSNKINVIDNNNNRFEFGDAKINLKNNEIVGREIKIDFVDDFFEIQKMIHCLRENQQFLMITKQKYSKQYFQPVILKIKAVQDGKLKQKNLHMIKRIKYSIIKILG